MEKPQRPADEYDQRALEPLQRLIAEGSVLALHEALHYCREYRVVQPVWLQIAAANRLVDLTLDIKLRKLGRAGEGLARDREDLKQFTRWDFVEDLKRSRKEWRESINELATRDGPQAFIMRRDLQKRLQRTGRNQEEMFDFVSRFLGDTLLAAAADTIKASYIRVERAMRCREASYRYYVYSPATLAAFGLQEFATPFIPVKKVMEFFHSES